jgi:hypothetical protein
MPDELNYPTAHDIARMLLDGPDLPVYDRDDRMRMISTMIEHNHIHLANIDECGMPSDPSSDHIYYYLHHVNDSNNIKCNHGLMLRFGHRFFVEEYLKAQSDNKDWVIKEATDEEYMKLYRMIAKQSYVK